MHELFEEIGIKISTFIAGLAGGIISLTFETKISFSRALILILTGGFCAGYLTPVMVSIIKKFLDVPNPIENSAAFIVGLISMKIVGGVMVLGERFKQNPTHIINSKTNVHNDSSRN